jgi:hypothetical protein
MKALTVVLILTLVGLSGAAEPPEQSLADAKAAAETAKVAARKRLEAAPAYKAAMADVAAKLKTLEDARAQGTPQERIQASSAYLKAKTAFGKLQDAIASQVLLDREVQQAVDNVDRITRTITERKEKPARTDDFQKVEHPAAVHAGPASLDDARRIVFVCDASGAMINKMPIVKEQLTKAFLGLKPNQSFEIIFFQDRRFDSFMKFSHANSLVPANPEGKRKAADFLLGVTTTGTSDPIPAIIAGFKTRPQLMYLLTDGDFPDNNAILKTIRDLQKPLGASEKVTINTIFFGDGDNDKAFKEVLRTIANESGGSFRQVKETDIETGSGAAACKVCGWCASTPTLHQSPA